MTPEPWHHIDWAALQHHNDDVQHIPIVLDRLMNPATPPIAAAETVDMLFDISPNQPGRLFSSDTILLLLDFTIPRCADLNLSGRYNLVRHYVRIGAHCYRAMQRQTPLMDFQYTRKMIAILTLYEQHLDVFLSLLDDTEQRIRERILRLLEVLFPFAERILPVLQQRFYLEDKLSMQESVLQSIEALLDNYRESVQPAPYIPPDMSAPWLESTRWFVGQLRYRQHKATTQTAAMIYLMLSPTHMPDDMLQDIAQNFDDATAELSIFLPLAQLLQLVTLAYPSAHPPAMMQNAMKFHRLFVAMMEHAGFFVPTHMQLADTASNQFTVRLFSKAGFGKQNNLSPRRPSNTRWMLWLKLIRLAAHSDLFWLIESNTLSTCTSVLEDNRDAVLAYLEPFADQETP